MELLLIEIGSSEWEYIWKYLEEHPINQGIENPSVALNQGEAWMYMGSYKQGDKVLHNLRHRLHPKTNKLYDITLQASDGFTPELAKKIYKL